MADNGAKEARAEAKAAQTKAKALRPWYRKKRNILVGLIALIVIVIIAANAGSKKNTSATGPSTTTAPATTPKSSAAKTVAAAPTTPGIGQVAKDGAFAFVVKSLSCGAQAASAVNSGGYGETVPAGAQECIVTMSVTNDKTAAQTFYDSNQYAYDAKGRQLSADSSGSIYLTGSQDGNQINPGITVTAPVPFQIPAGDSIVKLVLHDSAYSGGVTVRV